MIVDTWINHKGFFDPNQYFYMSISAVSWRTGVSAIRWMSAELDRIGAPAERRIWTALQPTKLGPGGVMVEYWMTTDELLQIPSKPGFNPIGASDQLLQLLTRS